MGQSDQAFTTLRTHLQVRGGKLTLAAMTSSTILKYSVCNQGILGLHYVSHVKNGAEATVEGTYLNRYRREHSSARRRSSLMELAGLKICNEMAHTSKDAPLHTERNNVNDTKKSRKGLHGSDT